MKTLVWGGGLFMLGLTLQIVLWKIRLPERQTKTLLALMLSVLFCGLATARLLPASIAFAPRTLPELLHCALLGLALIFAWMITYSAIEADSPSLVILLSIDSRGTDGMPEAELYSTADDAILVLPRVKDLLTDRMATQGNGKYRLTAKGRAMAALFAAQRALLGLGKGG